MSDPIVNTFPARKRYTNNKQKKEEGLAVPSLEDTPTVGWLVG